VAFPNIPVPKSSDGDVSLQFALRINQYQPLVILELGDPYAQLCQSGF